MRCARSLYYRTVSRFAQFDIVRNAGEFQLIDRVVVEALRKFDDYYPYIRGMIASCGFRRVGVPYTWKARARGYSKARFYHLIDQALNAVISLSNVPMRPLRSVISRRHFVARMISIAAWDSTSPRRRTRFRAHHHCGR